MLKTKFSSYCVNSLPSGCKLCVRGKKLVVFITGLCQRNCWYCSLSEKRKNKDKIWVNEIECKNIKEMLEEAKESRATSAGITGGDPFLCFKRTLKFVSALKRNFGKNFHIHIYLPTKFLTKEKLKKLSKYIDEVRFHPEFLARKLSNKEIERDIERIKQANLFWKKQDIGIELPMLPDKKQSIFEFIKKISKYIGFVNLNELEISDTNFNFITKNYKLKEGGYVVAGSKEAGLWILKKCEKENKLKLKVHLCTAELKNNFQFRERLKRHKILPFGKRTKDGLVVYFITNIKNHKTLKKAKLKFFIDKKKNRIILSEKTAKKLLNFGLKVERVEEFPTYDAIEVEREEV